MARALPQAAPAPTEEKTYSRDYSGNKGSAMSLNNIPNESRLYDECRNTRNNSSMSAGGGTVYSRDLPVAGWVKPSVRECSIGRSMATPPIAQTFRPP